MPTESASEAKIADAELWWPPYDSPEDVPAIEAIPLEDRGLPASTYEIVVHAALTHADRPALYLLPDAQRWDEPQVWTFAELCRRVHQIANLLTELGVGRRDAVALLAPNTGGYIAAFLAAEAVGIANPINPALNEEHVERILTTTRAKVLIAAGPQLDESTWRKAVDLARRVPSIEAVLALAPDDQTEPADADDLAQRAANQPGDRLLTDDRPTASDYAAYFHTGGTTGAPKVAVHTHGNEVAMAWGLAAARTLGPDAVLLGGLPLFHVNAVHVTMLGPLFKGQAVVWVGPRGYRDPAIYANFWRIVERYRITTFSAVPTVYARLADVPVDADISSLRYGVVGAAPLPAEVRRRFEAATGVPMMEGYGMTEATCASARSFPGWSRPGTVGRRMPYQHVRVVRREPDDSLVDCAPGEPGLLVISGPTVFAGYLRPGPTGPVADATGKVIDGWLDTGDLASLDPDGYIRLRGRAKDLIIRGGHNIDPADIEDALLAHPDVASAGAVGRPDPDVGEVPVAYVTLRPGARVTADELRQWAAEHVGERAAAPKEVTVLDELPVTEVGKPYKPALRHDAIRRVVVYELSRCGGEQQADQVRVRVADGEPLVTVPAPPDPGARQLLAERLPRYGFRWEWSG